MRVRISRLLVPTLNPNSRGVVGKNFSLSFSLFFIFLQWEGSVKDESETDKLTKWVKAWT